ncbi:MAG TPA: hypothetical protein VIF57_08175 [Polyangia bacterium]|jgi:hypothetical protein
MPKPIVNLVGATVADLAARVGGQVTGPLSWFDGFWDFVVENRVRLAREPAWAIAGVSRLPWVIVLLAPGEAAVTQFEAYLFVEAKDHRPGVTAPWPVSSVALDSAEAPRVGARDRFDRPYDVGLADQLRRRGFAPAAGYWGVRCDARVARDDSGGVERARAILTALPEALPLALALAARLPA